MNRVTNEESVDAELFEDDDELELVAVAPETIRPVGAQISVRFDSESARLLRRAASYRRRDTSRVRETRLTQYCTRDGGANRIILWCHY